jgi:hypothetical protein
MPTSASDHGKKSRFILKLGAVFGIVLAVLLLVAMRFVPTGFEFDWPSVPLVLGLCVAAGMLWAWTMYAYMQRYAGRRRAFYSELRDAANTPSASPKLPSSETQPRSVSVTLTMYTLRESFLLTLVTLYCTPMRALRATLVPLILGTCTFMALSGGIPSSIREVLALVGLAVVFSGLFAILVGVAVRRAHRAILQRTGGVTKLTFTGNAVEVSQEGRPPSTIPWSAIDGVREVGGYFMFARKNRFFIALPRRRVARGDLETLRHLLLSSKG